jgi:hypothetical protein
VAGPLLADLLGVDRLQRCVGIAMPDRDLRPWRLMRETFAAAAVFEARLTRYERQNILFRTAEIVNARKEKISDLITCEAGVSNPDFLFVTCKRLFGCNL